MKVKFKWVCIIMIVMMLAGFQAFAGEKAPAAAGLDGVAGVPGKFVVSKQAAPEAANWLSFFAVTPCRLYDSRNTGQCSYGTCGVWWPGRIEAIQIDGYDPYYQGGAYECPAPLDQNIYGEPDAVLINVAALPRAGGAYQGNVLAFPPQYAIPLAAALNYKYGSQNISNAFSVQTYDSIGDWDMGVINREGYCHIVIDVFGYYY